MQFIGFMINTFKNIRTILLIENVEICIMFKNKKRVEPYSLTYLFNYTYVNLSSKSLNRFTF